MVISFQRMKKLIFFQALCIKLFLVLGILWGCESIHFFIHRYKDEECQPENSSMEVFFRFVDFLNFCRGFFIFLIFICKRTVWIKMRIFYRNKFGLVESRYQQDRNGMRMKIVRHQSQTTETTSCLTTQVSESSRLSQKVENM